MNLKKTINNTATAVFFNTPTILQMILKLQELSKKLMSKLLRELTKLKHLNY